MPLPYIRIDSEGHRFKAGLSLAVFFLAVFSSYAGPKEKDVQHLIKQLGSTSFTDRQAAMDMLRSIGKEALPSLREAQTSRDLEVRRRVVELIDTIDPDAKFAVSPQTRLTPLHAPGAIVHCDTRLPGSPVVNMDLNCLPLCDDDLSQFRSSEFDRLRSLSLSGSRISDAGLVHLKHLSNLTVLSLSQTSVGDLGPLSRLKNISKLNLCKSKITDYGLTPVRHYKSLSSLCLDGTFISDIGLAHLQGLKGVRFLSLYDTNITDAGLTHLSGMKQLQILRLGSTKVSDAGLVHLKDMKNLRILDVSGTKVSKQGYADLKKLLPQLDRD